MSSDLRKLNLSDFTEEGQKKVRDYICEICRFVCNDLYSDNCGHPFCKDCIFPFVEESGMCPLTYEKLHISDLVKIKCIDDLINKQQVYCINKHLGCEWVDIITKRDFHLMDECKCETVNCPNSQCGQMIMRKDTKEHSNTCGYSILDCKLCNLSVFKSQLQQHLDEYCINREISCTQGCGNTIMRSKLERHIKDECELTLTQCNFKDYKCDSMIMRKDIHEHYIKDGSKHDMIVIEYLMGFQNRVLDSLNKFEIGYYNYEVEISKLEGKSVEKKKKPRGRRAYKID